VQFIGDKFVYVYRLHGRCVIQQNRLLSMLLYQHCVTHRTPLVR